MTGTSEMKFIKSSLLILPFLTWFNTSKFTILYCDIIGQYKIKMILYRKYLLYNVFLSFCLLFVFLFFVCFCFCLFFCLFFLFLQRWSFIANKWNWNVKVTMGNTAQCWLRGFASTACCRCFFLHMSKCICIQTYLFLKKKFFFFFFFYNYKHCLLSV